MNRQERDELLVRELFPDYEHPELPVPSQPDTSVEVESSGSPAPSEDGDRTPPDAVAVAPHAIPSTTPALGTDLKRFVKSAERPYRNTPFSPIEVQLAIRLRDQDLSLREIAQRLNRSIEGVRAILEQWTPTMDLAKAVFRKGAQELAERAVRNANVDQALEIADRLDVLPKRERDVGGNKTQIVIGMNIDDVAPKISVLDVPSE